MKLIKKIAAIMFAFMMVFSLGTNVKAVSGAQPGTTGTITINDAIVGQDYKIYKILELESFNTDPEPNGVYSYKPVSGVWNDFFTKEAGKNYVDMKDGYVTWKSGANEADLAKEAIAYAKKNTISDSANKTADSKLVQFKGLDLGYYLVDSSVGALCGLTTTNPTVDIYEKNKAPTVEKYINLETGLEKKNNVSIGDKFMYQIDINIGKGANNFELYDKLPDGLTLDTQHQTGGSPVYIMASKGAQPVSRNDYTVDTSSQDGSYTFKIKFEDSYLNKLENNVTLTVVYQVIVNENAPIDTAMTNKTWLTYGDHSTSTKESTTETFTFGIPVYKYTTKDSVEKPLEGVTFSLYTDAECTEAKILHFDQTGNDYLYNVGGATTILTSSTDGKFNVKGLKAGTYYLKEISTLPGYNKLTKPVTIKIEQGTDGNKLLKVDQDPATVNEVKVLNNYGSILPSTGGMGTTLIYLIGGALVLVSGFVLANKKRAKAK